MSGSSPLARGTLEDFFVNLLHTRLIPARAGNTDAAARSLSSSSAHPRSRGEHAMVYQVTEDGRGSSPLARGTPRLP